MSAEVQARLVKSKRNLKAAEVLLSQNYDRAPVRSADFAMFQAAAAMGLAEAKTFSACSGWLRSFGGAFATPRKINRKSYDDLLKAFRFRQIANYDPLQTIFSDVAESALKKATEFVEMAEVFLKAAEG